MRWVTDDALTLAQSFTSARMRENDFLGTPTIESPLLIKFAWYRYDGLLFCHRRVDAVGDR